METSDALVSQDDHDADYHENFAKTIVAKLAEYVGI